MADSLTLLTMSNEDAQREMLAELLIPTVNVSDLVLGTRTPQGATMKVQVRIPPETAAREDWPYQGEAEFTFRRLDLSDTFARYEPYFWMDFPLTSAAVAAKMSQAFGVRIEGDDFVNEAITPTGDTILYRLRAAANSQRWRGWVDIRLYRNRDEIQELLLDGLTRPTVHLFPGLHYPSVTRLQLDGLTAPTNPTLPGFDYPP